jgi:hypothetical protein
MTTTCRRSVYISVSRVYLSRVMIRGPFASVITLDSQKGPTARQSAGLQPRMN